jgi:hypothetical protein
MISRWITVITIEFDHSLQSYAILFRLYSFDTIFQFIALYILMIIIVIIIYLYMYIDFKFNIIY